MSDDAPQPPAGWYPTPDGGQRYWDGEKWLKLPAPDDSTPTILVTPDPTNGSSGPKRRLLGFAIAMACILLVVGGAAVTWAVVENQRVSLEQAAEADALVAQRAAEKEARIIDAREDALRLERTASIPRMEDDIAVMAKEHIADEIIDGPFISVDCSPVNGGSTDDLSEQTTVFECFVANVDNGDGTLSGYTYNATMNWSTGSYTYGLGAP